MLSTIEQLKELNLKPRKKLGQNFLIDQNIVKKLLTASNLKSTDIILEIGPGLGAITLTLAKQVKKVIAVEKDRELCQALKETLREKNIDNVEVINRDILNFQPAQSKYKIVANLPYNIATAVVMKFLEAEQKPKSMTIMLQKEVGLRMLAKPPKMNKLAVFSQLYAKIKKISYVSKNCFYPKPKVDSVILHLTPISDVQRQILDEKLFARIVKAGFSAPRKQLINNLSKSKELNLTRQQTEKWLAQNKISPSQRAETLSLSDWQNLAKSYPQPL